MAMKRIRDVPRTLPNARLYLDDLEEIAKILSDLYPNKTITYQIGDTEQYETITDLEHRGGSSSLFWIAIGDRLTGLRLYKILPPELSLYSLDKTIKWAAYAKVRAVFDSRGFKLRNALGSLPIWLRWALFFVWVIALPRLFNYTSTKSISIAENAVWLILSVLIGLELTRFSRVVFSRSNHVAHKGRESSRTYLTNFLFTLLGAALSVLLQALWDHFSKRA
jgi:hypothetical protein